MAALGHMYANGRGVKASNGTALKWWAVLYRMSACCGQLPGASARQQTLQQRVCQVLGPAHSPANVPVGAHLGLHLYMQLGSCRTEKPYVDRWLAGLQVPSGGRAQPRQRAVRAGVHAPGGPRRGDEPPQGLQVLLLRGRAGGAPPTRPPPPREQGLLLWERQQLQGPYSLATAWGAEAEPLSPIQGNTEAWFHLGVMHLNGWGVPRNVMQAQYFFSMTAKTVRRDLQQS